MSGDVQVRKRKDKKRKRDSVDRKSEGELFARKPSVEEDEDPKEHHGVHLTKMGTDDVHLHVQGDHETGGNWCAKVFFFSLLAILLGLIGLIIMENRGLSDLDTPLSESRFSNYFEGWVDEHRSAHDEHDVDKVVADHDGAFDEEDEHAEMEDEHELESEPDEADEEHEGDNADLENDGDEDEGNDEEDEEDEEAEIGKGNENDEEEDEDEGLEDTNEQYAADEEENEEPNDDDEEVDDEDNKPNDDDDDPDEGFGDNEASNEVDNEPKQEVHKQHAHDPFDEDDDFEDEDEPSVEIVENDAGEQLHLQQKKEQEAPQNEDGTNAEGSSSSIAVKIIVGVALAFVARLVLIRQNRSDNTSSINVEEKPCIPKEQPEMIPTEDDIPFDEDEEIVEEYEEEEDEEEGERFGKEEREQVRRFQPATFEELNAMYRPQAFDNLSTEKLTRKVLSQPYNPSNVVYHSDQHEKPNLSNVSKVEPVSHPSFDATVKFAGSRPLDPPVQRAQPQTLSSPPAEPKTSVTRIIPVEQEHSKPVFGAYSREEPAVKSKETDTALRGSVKTDDNEPHSKEFIDEEEYDEELVEEEEEEDEDDPEISDVDDDDLMKRLEAKYGKLPERKYDSEEENVGSDEEDVEDPSWTKINSRGPQASYDEDSFFEEELRRANEEMLRNYEFR